MSNGCVALNTSSAVSFGQRQPRDGLVHREDRVHGALVLPGQIARHIGDGLQVLVIQARVRLRTDGPRHFADGDRSVPGEPQGLHGLEAAGRAWQPHDDRHVFARLRIVEEPDDLSRPGHPDQRRHGGGRQPRGGGLLAVHDERDLRMWRLDVPVGIDHAGGLLEDRLDLCGHLHPTGSVGPVHLGDQRLQHRRSGWHLRHLQRRAERPRDRQQPIADTAGHVVALLRSLPLGHQVHLQVRKVRGPAEKVVTHQSVEVVRRGCPDVLLDIHHGRIL